ncbi:MAG: N-acetyl-gamma-glutamyl-phosphate reductase [Pseudomonadota bacterium]|nr:MAG: N-acetyl-gamma-glutamyl-phosphate reductase [Pseudomonadota bacterium]
MGRRIRAAVIGGTGYGGAELLRRLLFHPNVEVVRVTAADNIGKKVGEVHFNLAGLTDLRFEEMPPREVARDVDVVFLAMPHKVTAKVALELLDLDVRIVDLSGDFRLRSAEDYRRFYGAEHPAPEKLGTFTYGLPELNREAIARARWIASPGCFATTIALGLLPLAKAGLLSGPVRTVAATGSSGSGANPQLTTHHPLRASNLRTYKPLSHQHQPEILQTLRDAGAGAMQLEFVPVSAPLPRGIFASSFVDVPEDVTVERLKAIWEETYGNEPFIRVVEGRHPEVVAVSGSNYVEVGFALSEPFAGRRSVVCFSALDNLVKGGAGQAIQSFNIMMGLDETLTLKEPGLWP